MVVLAINCFILNEILIYTPEIKDLFKIGMWQEITFVLDTSLVNIYIDGVFIESKVITPSTYTVSTGGNGCVLG